MIEHFVKNAKASPETPSTSFKPKGSSRSSKSAPQQQAPDDAVYGLSIDNISLASLGAYMMFDGVDSYSMQGLNEFILKANYVFPSEQPITVFLNSPGGDVYSGFGTIDLMECSRVKIQTVTVGIVASMGALIFTAGTKGMRVMSKNSFIMTHQFSTYFEGKYHEMIAQRGHEDDLQHRFIEHFLRHSKMNESEIKDVLLRQSDTYISAKEALAWGLCDKIQNPWE